MKYRQITKEGQQIMIKPEHAVHFYADKKILKNIVINLLSNAIKYSEPGTSVVVSIEEKPNRLTLKVADQGMGIPEEEQKHLFERFFRAKNVTNIQGTGLGWWVPLLNR